MIGMMWFDPDPKTDLADKIARAAGYYQHKYGSTPNLCFVHPQALEGISLDGSTIEVRPSRSVLPHHLWLGIKAN